MERTNCRAGARWIAWVSAALLTGACGLQNQEMPPLAGPSGFATSVIMKASPDSLPRDGSSQSLVTLTATDLSGKPIAGLRLSLNLATGAPSGAALSASEVTTGSNGIATFTVTAPASGSLGDIAVSATPVGEDASGARPRMITIAALPSNNGPPAFPCRSQTTACAFAFSVSPAAPAFGDLVTFDASCFPTGTCTTRGAMDEGVACNSCVYSWTFGNDGTASGMVVRHLFAQAGTYLVSLTVSDVGGAISVSSGSIVVSGLTIPTVGAVTSSPALPIAKQPATFTATATPAATHRIVSYQFIWGDGESNTVTTAANTAIIQHTYSQPGSFALTLTVRDDVGQTTTTNQVVTVSSGLTAAFTFVRAGTTVTFDASTSSSQVASTITDYAWDFESDGTYDTNGSATTVAHDYGASGTYRATLRITDSRGVTQTTNQSIVIP